jgi:flagellar hook-associated protein 3 FlgL
MRITSNMVTSDFLKNLNTNLNSLTKYQEEVSTGRALTSISDDPEKLIASMNARTQLNKISQYKSSINTAITWLDQTDTSVSQLNDVIKKAYTTTVQASNGTLTSDDKRALAEQIAQLRDQVVTIANSQSSDKYIFAGYNVNKAPFTTDGSGNIYYNGIDLTDSTNPALVAMGSQSIGYEVGSNTKINVSITGTELLGTGSGNIYTVLNGLYKALNSDADSGSISAYISQIQGCQSGVQVVQGKIGGLTNRLEMLKDVYTNSELNYTKQKSDAEDADIADAYTRYSAAQTVYNAALKVGTEILQQTVLDYLR